MEGGAPRIVLSAWRYDGIETRQRNPGGHDSLYGLPFFSCIADASDALDTAKQTHLYFGSEADARRSMFTWREFRANVIDLCENGIDDEASEEQE